VGLDPPKRLAIIRALASAISSGMVKKLVV